MSVKTQLKGRLLCPFSVEALTPCCRSLVPEGVYDGPGGGCRSRAGGRKFELSAQPMLAQIGGDDVELRLDVLAERSHGADDHDGDKAGDKSVFDSRGTRLVRGETRENLVHK